MAIGTLVTRTGVSYAGKLRARSISHGAITGGPFIPGELVTQATSLATGRVVFSESLKLFLRDITGTFNNTGVITGGTSGATATADALLAAPSWMAAYLTLGRLRDTVSVSRSRDVTTISDFDTPEDSFQDQIAGNQNANMSGTMNIEPGGASFSFFEQGMDGNLDVTIRRVLTNRAGSAVRTRYYQGIVTQFDEQDSVTDASTVSFTLALNDSSFNDPTV
jgi:hypothetical protein